MIIIRYSALYIYICAVVAHIWDAVEEAEEADKDDTDDDNVDAGPATEEVMEPNIKISNPTDTDETAEDVDPNWDKNKVIKDVAYFIRGHKFHDFDRRYYTRMSDSPRRLFQEFPKPPLRALHWEVHKHCDTSFTACLKYLEKIVKLTPLKRDDDTVTVMREQMWIMPNNTPQILATEKECQMARRRDNLTADPFQGPIERFQWRTSVSYYMCWYTMMGIPELALFGEPCDNHANCLDAYGANNRDPRADDSNPYACAEYSFCPDPCCPMKHIWYMKDCYQSTENPCYAGNGPGNRKCTLTREDNQDFPSIVLNQLNITCDCLKPGYEWSSRFGICVDIDECSRKIDNCSTETGHTCINLPGYYDCICTLGFVYSPQKKGCVPSRTITEALKEIVTEPNRTETKGLLSLIIRLITRSTAFYFFSDATTLLFILTVAHLYEGYKN